MAVLSVVNEVVILVGEIITICTTISQTVASLKSLGATSTNFPAEIVTLRARFKPYEEQIRNRGSRINSNIVEKLKTAQSSLSEAESKIQDLRKSFESGTCCFFQWWLYVKLYVTSFSAKLDEKIGSVNKALDDILKILKEEVDIASLAGQAADLQPIPTRISGSDDLYVPIEKSQKAVFAAVENLTGPPIVLLHGGVGKGKSTLARYVHKFHQNSKEVFHQVVLVNCAGSAKLDPSNKQNEILKRLCPARLPAHPGSETGDFKLMTAEFLLQFFLSGKDRGQNILIILDDVSDQHFIAAMLAASENCTHVKYLVTSQNPNLCLTFRKNTCFPIPMAEPKESEAETILATLARLKDNVVPDSLQGSVAQILKATGGNPLALACVASNFANSKDKADERAWEEASKALDEILGDPETMMVLPNMAQDSPARSLWAAMKICIDYVETQDAKAKDILFLMFACEGESVPDVVLRILHAATKPSRGMFTKSIEELRSRELLKESASATTLKLNFHSEGQTDQVKDKSWSLLTTLKLYIGKQMAGDEKMVSLFSALGGLDGKIKVHSSCVQHGPGSEAEAEENEKTKVAIAICALYFDADHSHEVMKEAATWACATSNMNGWNATIKDRRRNAIEPLIWLLDHSRNNPHVSHCVRKVLLRYLCSNELDDSNISILLELTSNPIAQLAMLIALTDIFYIEEIPLLKSAGLSFLQPLVHILKTTGAVKPNIQEAALRAVAQIAWSGGHYGNTTDCIVTSMPDLLPVLDCILQDSLANQSKSDDSAELAAHILTNMAVYGTDSFVHYILTAQGARLLTGLVKSLFKHKNPDLQSTAALALFNLASGPEDKVRLRILGVDGALECLVGMLTKDKHPKVQAAAAGALHSLSVGGKSIQLQISGEHGAIASLVKSLFNNQNFELQEDAALALANLASTNEEVRLRVLGVDGALECLVGMLTRDKHPKVQAAAARALQNLSAGGESIKLQISGEHAAIAGLVKSLFSDQNSELQEDAALALANLASTNQGVRHRILGVDGALDCLVGMLTRDKHPKVQALAARALHNLSTGGESIEPQISAEHGPIAGLVKSLFHDQNSKLQEDAAFTLGNLRSTNQEVNKPRVLGVDGALECLVGMLTKDKHPKAQSMLGICLLGLGLHNNLG